MDEQRLIDLEIKYAHQLIALEELQQVVLEQQRALDLLQKNMKVLTDRIEATTLPEIGPGNEKPPHY